ncbi:MAG: hypothetical protein FD123_946 [Bacteroidetes bacterium]|nr:MAG: hypothetical protein FD123_946 [Bacteroidota bacterium]
MKKGLTPEDKLDIALTFLVQKNEGSYLYPDSIKFKEHLKSKGIDDNEHLPIVLHLVRGQYVDAFYEKKEHKLRGDFPYQIKVTFRGIKFQHKGGYSKLLKTEKRSKIIEVVVKLIAILTFIVVVGNLILNYQKNTRDLEFQNSINPSTDSASCK